MIGVKCVVTLVLRTHHLSGSGKQGATVVSLCSQGVASFHICSGKLFTCDRGSLVCAWGSPRRVWPQRVSQEESGPRREF